MISFYSGFILAFILDRITKIFVLLNIPENSSIELFRFFHLSNIRNSGICFGFFDNPASVPFLVVISSIAVIFIIAYVHKKRNLPKITCICLGLINGGILGNLVDRIAYHGVIDFIDFRIWPVFNLADAFIVCGVLCIIIFYSRIKQNASSVF